MEKDFRKKIETILSKDFKIHSEVKGTHFSGKRLILDNVIEPLDKSLWQNKNVAFGIEYKDVEQLDGDTKNFTSWLAQCVDYAHTEWNGFGYLFVLSCPGLRSTDFAREIDNTGLLNKVMSQLGVGELKTLPHYGLTIVLQDKHRIWSEKNGIEEGKKWYCKRKFGSR